LIRLNIVIETDQPTHPAGGTGAQFSLLDPCGNLLTFAKITDTSSSQARSPNKLSHRKRYPI